MLKLEETKETKISKELENKILALKHQMKLEDAISVCKTAIESDPTNAKWHIYLGDIYIQKHLDIFESRQYIDEAVTEYQRALESNINPTVVHYKIAHARFLNGEIDKALNHVNISINLRYVQEYHF